MERIDVRSLLLGTAVGATFTTLVFSGVLCRKEKQLMKDDAMEEDSSVDAPLVKSLERSNSNDSSNAPPPSNLYAIGRKDNENLQSIIEVFQNLTTQANTDTIGYQQWEKACMVNLKLDLDTVALERVWAKMTADDCSYNNGACVNVAALVPLRQREIDLPKFIQTVKSHEFLRVIVKQLKASNITTDFVVEEGYDFTKSTNENYGVMLSESQLTIEFSETFADIRKSIDYSYHVNYTKRRQQWQDAVISKVVVRTEPQEQPWVVYTCGPMGAGKGYALSWMSRHGYFPLEDIVHIDPDYFKNVMPEWDKYVENGSKAGDMCHRESGFMQEIAQEQAMRNSQNVWVDGSLRDGKWFSCVFTQLRIKYPNYKFAIFVVEAPEDVVRERIKKRAQETGRSVPEDMIVDSLKSVAESLRILTPLVDFVARIDNSGTQPTLRAFQKIDITGNWSLIKTEIMLLDDSSEFPKSLAPLATTSIACPHLGELLIPTREGVVFEFGRRQLITAELSLEVISRMEICASSVRALFPHIPVTDTNTWKILLSPCVKLTAGGAGRFKGKIPRAARSFAFAYPISPNNVDGKAIYANRDLVQDSFVLFLLHGGFVYFDSTGKTCGINSLNVASLVFASTSTSDSTALYIQFQPPVPLSLQGLKFLLDEGRFQPTPFNKFVEKGARYFSWIPPGECLPGHRKIFKAGALVFIFHGIDGTQQAMDEEQRQNCIFPVCD